MDLNKVGFGAEAVIKFALDRTGANFKIYRPPDYVSIALLAAAIAMVRPTV